MKYDLKRVFAFFTKDSNYKKKLAIVSLYMLCAIILTVLACVLPFVAYHAHKTEIVYVVPIILCVGLIFMVAMQGYILETGSLRLKNSESDLPELKNFWHQVLLCIKAAVGGFLLYLPILVITLLIFFFDPNYLSERNTSFSGVGFPLDITANIIYFVLMFFAPSLLLNFLEKNRPLEFLNFKKAFGRIKSHFVKYLILLAILLAVQALAGFVLVLSIITVVGIILVPVITVFSTMASVDFIVQFGEISNSEKSDCTENEEITE